MEISSVHFEAQHEETNSKPNVQSIDTRNPNVMQTNHFSGIFKWHMPLHATQMDRMSLTKRHSRYVTDEK